MDFEKDNFEDDNELSRLEDDEELGGDGEVVEVEEEEIAIGDDEGEESPAPAKSAPKPAAKPKAKPKKAANRTPYHSEDRPGNPEVLSSSPSQACSGPQFTSSGSQTSARPPPKPKVLNPMDSRATLPARIMRSAQEILRPYFCLIGQRRRRALSRLTLSGQLLSGANRCWPAPAPPRPSPMRYVPALCQAMRMNKPP